MPLPRFSTSGAGGGDGAGAAGAVEGYDRVLVGECATAGPVPHGALCALTDLC